AAPASSLKPGWERETMERLLFATLAEQRRARRWRTFTRMAWLLFFLALFWAFFYRGAPKADKSVPHTAVVEIKGEIASGADASVGVLMGGFGFTGIMEKVGVERRLLTAGENKGFLDPFSPMTDKQKAFATTMLEQIHKQFIDSVKAGRGKRLKDTPELFSGL